MTLRWIVGRFRRSLAGSGGFRLIADFDPCCSTLLSQQPDLRRRGLHGVRHVMRRARHDLAPQPHMHRTSTIDPHRGNPAPTTLPEPEPLQHMPTRTPRRDHIGEKLSKAVKLGRSGRPRSGLSSGALARSQPPTPRSMCSSANVAAVCGTTRSRLAPSPR